MKKQVTVVPSDNLIIVDGVLYNFEFQSPENLHAIQWNGGKGHCEYTDSGNKELTEYDYEKEVAPYVALWEEEKAKRDAEEAAALAEYNKSENVKARMQAQYTALIQSILDTEAQRLGYDNCISICSYVDTGVQKFDDEGAAFRAWRSAVWEKGYELLAKVQAGEREIPTKEELVDILPKLTISYSD